VAGGGGEVSVPPPPQLGSRTAKSNREITGNKFLGDITPSLSEVRDGRIARMAMMLALSEISPSETVVIPSS
jgi:hypothetical protein